MPTDGEAEPRMKLLMTHFARDRKARSEKRYPGLVGNDRRFQMMMYSVDALNWFQAGCVARAESSQSFMYGTPVIHGDDMLSISRTSINADDQHDADHATFHRVKNFRSLALNLRPTQWNIAQAANRTFAAT